jgi:FKBP-type peptidyl-prolyl cis-trans isomerase FklB
MKLITIILLSLGFALSQTAGADDFKLETDDQKSSYAAGVQYMKALLDDNLTLDNAAFMQGLSDMQTGRESRLTPEETHKALDQIVGLRVLSKKNMEDKRISAGKAFLEENAKQPEVHVLDNGLQYKILSEGNGEEQHPKTEDGVSIRYLISDIDGKQLQASKADSAPKLLVKVLIPAWQEALKLMKPGDKWRLFMPPQLAFGKHGSRDGSVKSEQTLISDLELVALVSAEEAEAEMQARPQSGKEAGHAK